MRYTLILLILAFANNSQALSAPAECANKKDFVSKQSIKEENVQDVVWNERISERTDEYITTLNIVYKNGDMAIIEHMYCDMYNFKVSYFVADKKSFSSKESAAALIAKYFNTYSVKKTTFTPSLEKVLSDSLQDYKYSGDEKVEISFDTMPFDGGFPFRRLINLYVGVGGAD